MRIGTWNVEGRWSAEHASLLLDADADIWLLTEVRHSTQTPGYDLHATTESM
jgi:exonuclease III